MTVIGGSTTTHIQKATEKVKVAMMITIIREGQSTSRRKNKKIWPSITLDLKPMGLLIWSIREDLCYAIRTCGVHAGDIVEG